MVWAQRLIKVSLNLCRSLLIAVLSWLHERKPKKIRNQNMLLSSLFLSNFKLIVFLHILLLKDSSYGALLGFSNRKPIQFNNWNVCKNESLLLNAVLSVPASNTKWMLCRGMKLWSWKCKDVRNGRWKPLTFAAFSLQLLLNVQHPTPTKNRSLEVIHPPPTYWISSCLLNKPTT